MTLLRFGQDRRDLVILFPSSTMTMSSPRDDCTDTTNAAPANYKGVHDYGAFECQGFASKPRPRAGPNRNRQHVWAKAPRLDLDYQGTIGQAHGMVPWADQ